MNTHLFICYVKSIKLCKKNSKFLYFIVKVYATLFGIVNRRISCTLYNFWIFNFRRSLFRKFNCKFSHLASDTATTRLSSKHRSRFDFYSNNLILQTLRQLLISLVNTLCSGVINCVTLREEYLSMVGSIPEFFSWIHARPSIENRPIDKTKVVFPPKTKIRLARSRIEKDLASTRDFQRCQSAQRWLIIGASALPA